MPISYPELIQNIIDSGLIPRAKLELFCKAHPPDQVKPLIRTLMSTRSLTPFQATWIQEGRGKELCIGNLALEAVIGEGGMGTVYRARHVRMNRNVAVKVMHTSADTDYTLKRFQREVETAAQLTHSNVVTAFDAGKVDDALGSHFLVMEYVAGKDLVCYVEQDGPFNLAKAADCILQAAMGLHYAHSKGIVHRDIKPGNVLLTKEGVVKVLDMGLARFNKPVDMKESTDDQELTQENQIVGTVDFMSPEQADDSKNVDIRTDIYSLGCTLYYLLTGKPPFYRSSLIKTLVAHRVDEIPLITDSCPDFPKRIDKIFQRMVAKNPEERYSTMADVIRQLKKFDDDTDFEIVETAGGLGGDDDDESDTQVFDPKDLASLEIRSSSKAPRPDAAPSKNFKTATFDRSATLSGELLDDGSAIRGDSIQEAKTAVGIDLGTTFSAIAYLDDSGRPQTLVNAEGDKTTPSSVLFEGDDVIVGKEAIKAMATDMEFVAQCAKRELGETYFHQSIAGKKYPPEVILAWILKKLRRDAETQIGAITDAVVTVPAYFDEVRRRATQRAGHIAGLNVIDIINEPTAAAVAYGYQQGILQSDKEPTDSGPEAAKSKILVYDLGGGTFDVTVMEIQGSKFVALATDGDVRLGGRDWDQRLVDFVAERFAEQHEMDPRQDKNALGRLLRECEDSKHTLSSRQKTHVAFDYKGQAIRVEITRELFESLTEDLLARTEFTTRETLKAAEISWDQLDRILLVGGSTRMPSVADLLKSISGISPDRSVSPDEAVAHGAALLAGMLLDANQSSSPMFEVLNVNSHSLGVVGMNPKTRKPQSAILIKRNSTLPIKTKRSFRTKKANQSSILVRVVEGESRDPDECSQMGKCIIRNLPENLPVNTQFDVIFEYEENGLLTVKVKLDDLEMTQTVTRENELGPDDLVKWQKLVIGDEAKRAFENGDGDRWK